MRQILALSTITFWEGIRNRSVFGVMLFSLFILGLNIAVAGFFMRDVGKVTVDMNLSALNFAGLLLIFFVGLNLIAKDIDKKTIQMVLSKPISRDQYVVGKFFGIQMFIFVSILVLSLFSVATIFILLNIYSDYFLKFSWIMFIVASFFIFVKISVISSIVIFFSSLTSNSFITLIVSISLYVVGETIEEVIFYLKSGLAEKGLAMSETLRQFIEVVSYLIPNLSVFDFKTEAAHGMLIGSKTFTLSLGYGIAYVAVLLFLSSMIFKRREFY